MQAENRSLKEHIQKLEVQFSQTEEDLNDLEHYGHPKFQEQCFSIFLLQRNLPQMFALLVEPYAIIHATTTQIVVANFVPCTFSL